MTMRGISGIGFDYTEAFLERYISYMQCYGDAAVDSLWKIPEFGPAQKKALWDIMCNIK